MRFDARVLGADHRIVLVSVEANDLEAARRQLEAQSLRAIDVRPSIVGRATTRRFRFPVMLFTQELLALLSAGLGIVEALEALEEKEAVQSTKALIGRLLQRLREGNRLSAALAEHTSVFPPIYVGLVRSAEGTSDLPVALERYVAYQQRVDTVRNKVVSASLYPLILCAVGGVVTVFLMAYVVPRFAVIYQDTGRPLPLLSLAMIKGGKFIAGHSFAFGIGAVTGTVALAAAARSFLTNGGLGTLLLRLPLVGEHVRMYQLSRLYLTLGVLLEGGMPIMEALRSARAVIPRDWGHAFDGVSRHVEAGYGLAAALEGQRLTTAVSLRMLRVGEQSGQMGQMLRQAAQFYEGDISRFVDRFTRTFEPLLMAVIGVVVGSIVILLYMPIFDLASSLE
ncbi:type II secretion system F family protein [Burkholderia sp. Ac-20353]|uniref:type II secretion system F family protein n=1 Tax=Burkholderia sp. Ac-20353 TaxID=2703894 RepID=UPI00197BE7A1|nr:type II secretion system F family protein [Burkholderia sp. Ac-20353]MBN3788940.1 type II secretion system F family protein [Burkholderia sp. Ac-20353]